MPLPIATLLIDCALPGFEPSLSCVDQQELDAFPSRIEGASCSQAPRFVHMDEERPSRRFFVRVFADDPDELANLREAGLDLFPGVSRPQDVARHSLDGLLTLDEIARVVENGLQVLVETTLEARSNANPADIDATTWKRNVLRRVRRGGS